MPPKYQNKTFKFSKLTDAQVEKLLKENNIGLSINEAREIEKNILKRPPTLAELIAFSIQGSEHCSYRSSKKYLSLMPTDGPNVIQGPKEDAGIVEIARDGKERYGIVMGHESHNHPSQIVPYEGAATGIGGIVRDIVCMGAKVIAVADPLRFGGIKTNKTRWIADNVVNGIAGYGNPIGVPNIGGDVYFNKSYDDNCLVNVVALGIIKESEIIHSCAPKNSVGYKMILVGKPTDNSGFGGASFASFELDDKEKEKNKGAVQEPNAFLKRHLMESTYDLFKVLRKKKLFKRVGFKDLGAGGIICVTSEMAESAGCGAEIDIEKVHVGMDNLPPHVTLCAETQERFLWIADDKTAQLILDHYNNKWELPKVSSGARASIIGKVTDGNYVVKYNGVKIVDIEPKSLCGGLRYDRKVERQEIKGKEEKILAPKNLNDLLKKVLAHENVACRVPIFEQYDKQVQGNTIIESGQADAGVMAPLVETHCNASLQKIGIALSVDANPRYGLISAYWQSANAVVESMRNVTAVGAYPIALTDCLNYGNPEKPEQMAKFVEGVEGIADACKNIHLKISKKSATPIISGNVSMYNQSKTGTSITPSAVIACLGKINDYKKAITMRFKKSNSAIYLIGQRKDELGGSVYYDLFNKLGVNIPKPDFAEVEQEIYAVTDAIEKSLILACHDISDGGMATALAEMCFDVPTVGKEYDKVGIEVELNKCRDEALPRLRSETRQCNSETRHCLVSTNTNESVIINLFSETGGFILEVEQKNIKKFESLVKKYKKIKLFKIGKTTKEPKFVVKNDDENLIDLDVLNIEKVWLEGLRDKM
ncbi:MAG: phosphoribosylformylglycinamidine synthase subunit PurL [bacterium]